MRRLTHPLWIHLPSFIALATFVALLVGSGPLPSEAPIHFGPDGKADNWGSPAGIFMLVVALAAGLILISVLLSELWARQERQKTFNPLSLIDELFVGWMAAMGIEYLAVVNAGGTVFLFPWQSTLLWVGAITAAAAVLEKLRPYRRYDHQVDIENTWQLREKTEERIRNGDPLVYWESQNPAWMTVVLTLLATTMFTGAVANLFSEAPWVSAMLFPLGVLVLLLVGGIRTTVTREQITVRFGTPGFRVLSLRTSDLASVQMRNFEPLRDFGGYGIRENREMKAYYVRGTRGVLLTTAEGKRHLVGSDSPERLAAFMQVVVTAR